MPGDTIYFTVVIPVFNGATYITRAIESCLQQTLRPRQIIVIDDASTDDTGEMVKSLRSDLIRYERNDQNRGPSYSRNRGMQMATGSWIVFLDADDLFHPHKLETISYCIQNNENIRAIGHAFNLVEQAQIQFNSQWKNSLPPLKYYSAKQVLWSSPVVTPSLAVSAANAIFFDESMVYAEDHDFILRTAEKFGLYYLDMPLCSLQRLPLTPGGISSHKWQMRVGEMKMYIRYGKRHHNYLAIPFLLLFSLLKHLRNILLQR